MGNAEIVDIVADPGEERRALWRRLLRYGVPIGMIVLITAGLVASTLYTNAMNRKDVLGFSRDFIDVLNQQVNSELRAHLQPARLAAGNLSAALPDEPWSAAGRETFERIALDILRRTPQLASAYFATPEGQFLMVRRNPEGSADTKRIERTAEGPAVTWLRRDRSWSVVGEESDPEDRYDPRARGWYQDAIANPGVRWSDVYTFFTDRTPGITVSSAVDRNGQTGIAVVGVDIFLNSLSDILAALEARARGTLAIVSADGQVIAFHQPEKVLVETESGLRSRTVRELGLPALAEAFDRMRVEGADHAVVEIDDTRYIFGAASLRDAVSRDWWLLLLAPEETYLGFVTANGRRGLIVSGVVVGLAIILAVFLGYQGMASDRIARETKTLRRTFTTYRQLLADLAGASHLSDPADERDLRRAGEILARAEAARRVSFWRIDRDRGLVCLDAFETDSRGHVAGIVLESADCPALLEEVRAGAMIDVADTASDPRTAAIHSTYFQAVGTGAVYSVPILMADRALGAIWIEDPDAKRAITVNHNLTRSVANMLSTRLQSVAAAERRNGSVAHARPSGPPARPSALPDGAARQSMSLLEKRAALQQAGGKAPAASTSVFPGATVLYLKLLNDRALVARSAEQADAAIIRKVVAAFEEAANRNEIPYVKFLTDQILAIDGFGEQGEGAAERLVDVALDVRERLTAVFLSAGQGPQFAMGIDSGPVFGAVVGAEDQVFNVWGEAVRVAKQLAETTEPGSIQVSETSYERLRESCIFRRRGAFYFEPIGEMATFSLRGRV